MSEMIQHAVHIYFLVLDYNGWHLEDEVLNEHLHQQQIHLNRTSLVSQVLHHVQVPILGQVAPVQVAPVQVAPVQVALVQVAPVQVAPVQTALNQIQKQEKNLKRWR